MPGVTKNAVRLGGAYVEITADNGKLLSTLKETEGQVKSFADDFAKIGASLAAVGVGVAAPLKEAVDTYAEFEKQMLITQAVTRSTDLQLAKLTKQAKELGAATSWTSAQVAEGMTSLGRMGFSNKEIQESIEQVMDLGRALDVNVGTAAKELGSVMRQFGADSWEAGRYADVLAKATNSSATAMSELLDTMKYVGTAGASLGADVETVLALTMALRNAGLTASQAGTQLRTMFLKLQNPKNINKFSEEFGVDIYDANGRLKSFLDILIEAQARAVTMGDNLSVVARNMFGVLQAPGFLALLQSPDLARYRDELYDAEGAAKAFRESMESGVFGSLKRSQSYVEAVSLTLGESLRPTVIDLELLIKDITDVARDFIEANKPLINMMARAAIEFGSVGTAVLATAGVLKGLAGISNITTSGAARLVSAWRKAGDQTRKFSTDVEAATAAAGKLAAVRPGEAVAASMAKATAAAKETTAAVSVLAAAESKLGQTFSVSTPTGTPAPRIDTSGMTANSGTLAAPASVVALINARDAEADRLNRERQAARQKELEARRAAIVEANKEYNTANEYLSVSRQTATTHRKNLELQNQSATIATETLTYIAAENKAAEEQLAARRAAIESRYKVISTDALAEAYAADKRKPINIQPFSVNDAANPFSIVVAPTVDKKQKAKDAMDNAFFVGGAAPDGTFRPSGGAFSEAGMTKGQYGLSVNGKINIGSFTPEQRAGFSTTSQTVEPVAIGEELKAAWDENIRLQKENIEDRDSLFKFFKELRQENRARIASTASRFKRNQMRKESRSQQRAIIADLRKNKAEAEKLRETVAKLNQMTTTGVNVEPGQVFDPEKMYNDQLEKFFQRDERYQKANKRWNKYVDKTPKWNIFTRVAKELALRKDDAEFDRVLKEFHAIYGRKKEFIARMQSSVGEGSAGAFTVNPQADNINATTKATEDATKATFKLNETVNGTAVSTNRLGETGQAAGRKVAAGAKAGSVGMQALKFATNAALGVMKLLGGMALSMLAWEAVALIFEKIASYAAKTAKSMAEAREANVNTLDEAQEENDALKQEAYQADDLITRFVAAAGSNKDLNFVERKNLDRMYDKLVESGYLTDAEVVKDENAKSGYRIVNAGAAAAMQARAREKALGEYEKSMSAARFNMESIDPTLVKKNPALAEASFKDAVEIAGKYQPLAKALGNLTPGQRKELLGGLDVKSLQKELNKIDIKAKLAAGMVNGFDEDVYNLMKREAIAALANERIENAKKYGDIGDEDKQALYSMFFGDRNGVIAALSQDAGYSWLDEMKKLDALILPEEVIKGIKEDIAALKKDAEANKDKEYESDVDKQKRENDEAAAKATRETSMKELDALLEKQDEKQKTLSERRLDELNKSWEKTKAFYKDENGEWKSGIDDKEKEEFLKKETSLLERREELQKKINEELEKQAQDEKKRQERERKEAEAEQTERDVEALNAGVDKMIEAFMSADFKTAQEEGKGIDVYMKSIAALSPNQNLSDFYRESVSKIASAISKTQVTLTTTGTFNPYEFLDMGNDVELDVQREQLANLREANRGLRNIYAWMQTDDRFKEYM